MKLKIDAADRWFSRCVRIRNNWVCESCGAVHHEKSQGLQCSHFYSRSHRAIRTDLRNAFAHCTGCHTKLGGSPPLFTDWFLENAPGGQDTYDALRECYNDLGLAKRMNREFKDISYHYRTEYRRIYQMRLDGVQGRIEPINYE